MKLRNMSGLVLSLLALIAAGCGGGGNGAAISPSSGTATPTRAVVKLATSGTLPAGTLIGGIQTTVTYPTTGLSIAAGNVVASGVGSTPSLFVPNANNAGQVILGSAYATGIQTGEFATLTFSITTGTSPAAGDFAIAAGATVTDVNGATIPGIAVTKGSVTIQ